MFVDQLKDKPTRTDITKSILELLPENEPLILKDIFYNDHLEISVKLVNIKDYILTVKNEDNRIEKFDILFYQILHPAINAAMLCERTKGKY